MLMTKRGLLGSLAASVVLISGGCGRRFQTYRYRLSVEVETPQGLRVGSSVIEVASGEGKFGTMGEVGATARGEAVAVDLPGNGVLFALLRSASGRGDAATGYAFDGLPARVPRAGESYADDLAELLQRRDIGVMPREAYPLLVTFRDTRDPKSVERVDPNNLAEKFGSSIKLKQITVQITNDPVTNGIKRRLAWLDSYYDRMLDGGSINNSQELANNLTQSDFIVKNI